jgi:DNA mismatch endonuclease (patch repair protein)
MANRPIALDKKTGERLSKVRSRGTKIEKLFEAAIRKLGYTNLFVPKEICGRPDFADPSSKVAVFLDGCFWHGHSRCYKAPKHNLEYWQEKVQNNKKRRRDVRRKLKKKGWLVLEFWECDIKKDCQKIAEYVDQMVKKRLTKIS